MRLADGLLLSEKRADGMVDELVPDDAAVLPAVTHSNSSLEVFRANFGTFASACFLFLIGPMNLVILGGIIKAFQAMRRGEYDEAELERQLGNRGFFYRFFGRWMKAIDKEWQMYPVGVVFGMGFDAATEVLLLTTTAFLASEHIPWQAIIALPILFTAGMSLTDTSDGMSHRNLVDAFLVNSMAARRGAGQPIGRAAWPLRKQLVRVRALPYPGLAPTACPRREPGAPSRRY
jgi:High-affinity nickel-transport protein